MPELPEVETVVNSLKSKLIGRRIVGVNIYYDKVVEYPTCSLFKKQVVGQTINNITRRGKYIMFELDNYYLLSHLRMEGKYFFKNNTDALLKHEHIVFILDNNVELRYHDTRKFGRMYLVDKDKVYTTNPLNKLGIEPFDNNLTSSYLKNIYESKNKPIKSVLLDQTVVVGIGNIYADEILFTSHINPYRLASSLSLDEADSIIKNTRVILNKAIKLGGSTIRSYTSVDGVSGKFQNELLVHGRNKCPICNSDILKVVIGTRSTYYCPKCQK